MLSVCDAEVLAGEVFGLMLVRVGSGFAGGLMMKAMGLERPLFVALVEPVFVNVAPVTVA